MKVSDIYTGKYRKHYGRFSKWRDRRAGRREATKGIPLADDATPESVTFCRDILSEEKQHFHDYAGMVKRVRDENVRKRTDAEIALKQNELKLAAAEDRAKVAQQVKERERQHYLDLRDEIGRPHEVGISPTLRNIVIIAASIGDSYLNHLAFERIGKIDPALSWVVAILVGATLVFIAYLGGLLFKRSLVGLFESYMGKHRSEERMRIAFLCFSGAVLLFAFAALICFFLGELRQQFMDAPTGAMTLSAFFSENVPKLVTLKANVPLKYDALVLIAINLAVVFGGAFLSFVDHDAVWDFTKAKRAMEKADREWRKLGQEIEKLRHERVKLNAELEDIKREGAQAPVEVRGRRGIRAAFAGDGRFAQWCDGYERKAKKAAPKAIKSPDLGKLEQAIMSDEAIDALFSDE